MQNNEDSCAERQSLIESNHGYIQTNESMTTARQSLHEDRSPLTACAVSLVSACLSFLSVKNKFPIPKHMRNLSTNMAPKGYWEHLGRSAKFENGSREGQLRETRCLKKR